jgi:hypothetical protein
VTLPPFSGQRGSRRGRGDQSRLELGRDEVAQVDFGYVGKLYDPDRGVLRKAWVFVMTLGFSRHMVARITFDQKVETWLRVHIECFEELGGVPKTIVPDNLKAAVTRAAFGVDGETELNRSYRELARHYGFVVDPTPPRSPEKKGKVESSVRYVKTNYFKAHAPEDIRDAEAGLQRWLIEIAGQRRHGTTGRSEVGDSSFVSGLGPADHGCGHRRGVSRSVLRAADARIVHRAVINLVHVGIDDLNCRDAGPRIDLLTEWCDHQPSVPHGTPERSASSRRLEPSRSRTATRHSIPLRR